MTVAELIIELKSMDQSMNVQIAQPTRDYWRQVVAKDINLVKIERVSYNVYHSCDVLQGDDEISCDVLQGDDEIRSVVVLQ